MTLPIVIVGGGTAGSTVALHLASRTERPIIVCEPGDISKFDFQPRFFDVLAQRNLVHDVSVCIVGRQATYTQAHAIGGGSAINGMLLTGDAPSYVDGLTSVASPNEMGDVSHALLAVGGRASRLWWNDGRWNPGRALFHLVEEGRVTWKKSDVSRLFHDGDKVTSVAVGGEIIFTDCVVLAAGALASPKILFNSEVAGVCEQIGDNLQDHPVVWFTLQRCTENVGVFDASVVLDLSVDVDGIGMMIAYERTSDENADQALVSVMLMNPDSRGSISVTGDGLDIDLGLLATDRDAYLMRHFVRSAINILNGREFNAVARQISVGSEEISLGDIATMDDVELDQWIAREVIAVSHACSSGCVNERGELRGIHGVVVADASVLPHVPHETPAAAVTMEALRIAELLGEKLT